MSTGSLSEQAIAMIGLETGPGEPFPVEQGWVRKFAEAAHDASPIYYDMGAAQAAGYANIPAHPCMFLYNMRSGSERDFNIPLPLGRRVKGEDELEFFVPVVVGDTVTANTKILDIVEKEGRSGKMIFVITETTYTNQRGELVMRNKATVIKR